MRVGALVAALLLPPLGVWLAGGSARAFWMACGLTLLGYVPGVVFAVATVARPRPVDSTTTA